MESLLISIEDLTIAYRKAKIDAFYETGHLTSLDFANYETNLFENLNHLCEKINKEDLNWFADDEFVGEHVFSIKKVEFEKSNLKKEDDPFLYYSNHERTWEKKGKPQIEYRIFGKHSINFHILSSLWIEKVGYKLEACVSANSYGCRLRNLHRMQPNAIDSIKQNEYRKSEFGHFSSYLPTYRKWQYKGVEEIKKHLQNGKKIVAVTADLRKYYHRIDPLFILSDEFIAFTIKKEYTKIQSKLNKLLLVALKSWSQKIYTDKNVPISFKYKGHVGIPMGLGAAKVIANLLLIFLDREIENEVKPLYYGRYVDDLFIVIEDGGNIASPDQFWTFLQRRILNLRKNTDTTKRRAKLNSSKEYCPEGYVLSIPYAANSLVEFGKGKEKYFFLEGTSGETFLNVLKQSLDENSSEWNLPPNMESDFESFNEEVTNASSDHKEIANGLRKSDGVSIQRLKFILYLKRFETITRFLPQSQWHQTVKHLFSISIEHTITPDTIAVYSKYYPRVISLATRAGMIEVIEKFIERIDFAFEKLAMLSSEEDKYCITNSQSYLKRLLAEGIYSSVEMNRLTESNKMFLERICRSLMNSTLSLEEVSNKLFTSDLHKIPFKSIFITQLIEVPNVLESHNIHSGIDILINTEELPKFETLKDFSQNVLEKTYPDCKFKETFMPYGFYFFTRPFTLFELTLIIGDWYDNIDTFREFCKLFYIDWPEHTMPEKSVNFQDNKLKTIHLSSPNLELDRTIAFTSLETKPESWIAVVQGFSKDPDGDRVQRILSLVTNILKSKKQIDYVLFPELSIPRELLIYVSQRLLFHNISLIAGVEYEISKPKSDSLLPGTLKYVSNQLYFILTIQGSRSSNHIVIKQEKVIPAQKEERDLFDFGGAVLHAVNSQKFLINHGGFWIAGLICNDFLDINNRAMFRGFVDALVVVEWNQDVETYNALIESSANDLHAFVMQVNNRLYGDTRLRAPYKESFMRDMVRVRGGELDYFVIATLQVNELRKFQRNHRSPKGPFKPIPNGYEMSTPRRKT